MAEAILNVVAEAVLNKVFALASEELSLQWGFKDDLQRLTESLEIIQDLLLDADGKRISLRSVQRWLKNLSSVASDADNVLDAFGYEILHQQALGLKKSKLIKVREFFSSSNPLLLRHVLGQKIKEVNSMFDDLYKRASDIGLEPVELLHTSAQLIEIRTSDPFVNVSNIVGRDGDKEKVLEMLELPVSVDLEVVSIVGMPGQGKTTLAQIVYDNERVANLFFHRIWICVSDDFNVDRLLKEMMQCLCSAESHESSESHGSSESHESSDTITMIENIKEKLNDLAEFHDDLDESHESSDTKTMIKNIKKELDGSAESHESSDTKTMIKDIKKKLDGLAESHESSDTKTMIKNIKEKLDGSAKLSNTKTMMKNIKKKLNGKKYLLVLDDVWNEDPKLWETMKTCLTKVCVPKGNKVLVTTRSETVVSTMQTSRCHSLQALSNDHSWELFSKIVFADGGPVLSKTLKAIGERMVKKCKCVPLAIKALARLMRTIKDENEWAALGKNEKWASQRAGDEVLSSMRLSYDHLPSLSLKQSFAYCSLFVKDTKLEKEKLIQLWTAQGLVNPPEENQAADVEYFIGNNYFNVLMQNSFFDNSVIDEYGRVKSCKMHDLVHDLSLEISKGYCCTLLSGQAKGQSQAIHLISDEEQISQIPERFPELRTLYLVSGVLQPDLLVSLTSVRVLILEDEGYSELPRSIRKLKHLRYLDISKTSIQRLPESICKLYYLQTLKLNLLTDLPPKFENLVNLRYFYILSEKQDKLGCVLPKVGQLTNLLALPYFVVRPEAEKGCGIKELGALAYLRGKLTILGLEHVASAEEAKQADLSNKSGLDSLELSWNETKSDGGVPDYTDVLEGLEPHPNLKSLKVFNFGGTSLPTWMLGNYSILENLQVIELRNFNQCTQVPALGCLPCIKTVGLYGLHNVTEIGINFYGLTGSVAADSTDGNCTVFPSLKEIIVEDMPSLKKWEDGKHPSGLQIKLFSELEKFRVQRCPALSCLPGMENVKNLREFKIAECSALEHLPVGLERCVSLRSMEIKSCDSLLTVPDMHNLGSLLKLELKDCKSLKALPAGIESLALLKEMVLGSFSVELDSFPWPSDKGKSQPPFPSLTYLHLFGWEELTELPEQLKELPALSSLRIKRFKRLEALPEWLAKTQTLRKLVLEECNYLKDLPELDFEVIQRHSYIKRGVTNFEVPVIKTGGVTKAGCSFLFDKGGHTHVRTTLTMSEGRARGTVSIG